AQAAKHVVQRLARWIQADVLDLDARSRNRCRSDEPERRGRKIARDRELLGDEALASGHRYGQAVDRDGTAKGEERPLGVVARRRRLEDTRGPLSVESREEDGALHLGARNIRPMGDGLECSA